MVVVDLSCPVRVSSRVLYQFEVKVYQLVEAFEHGCATMVFSTKRKWFPLKDVKGFSGRGFTREVKDESSSIVLQDLKVVNQRGVILVSPYNITTVK